MPTWRGSATRTRRSARPWNRCCSRSCARAAGSRSINMTATADLSRFVERLRIERRFEPGAQISIARAPGRLDVMGGIADYSGSLVLQRPIAEAAFAAVQRIDRPVLEIVSIGRAAYSVALDTIAPGGQPISYGEVRSVFADRRGR